MIDINYIEPLTPKFILKTFIDIKNSNNTTAVTLQGTLLRVQAINQNFRGDLRSVQLNL